MAQNMNKSKDKTNLFELIFKKISKQTKEMVSRNVSTVLTNNMKKDLKIGRNGQQMDYYLNNSLGLSPVKKEFHLSNSFNNSNNSSSLSFENIKNNESNESCNELIADLNGIQMNSFSFNKNSMNETFEGQSDFMNESFQSLSKCSDLDLKADERLVSLDQTFRSPNSEFENKSINSYFKQNSEPICEIDLFSKRSSSGLSPGFSPGLRSGLKRSSSGLSFGLTSGLRSGLKRSSSSLRSGLSSSLESCHEMSINSESGMSFMNESFISIADEISPSDNTLLIAQKIIDKNNRKRKADKSETFVPKINSTRNLREDNSNNNVLTSGLGTISTLETRAQSSPHSESSSMGSSIGNTLNMTQLLTISPTHLSLTIGCFATFKLNYLKVKNLSIASFKAIFKISANVDILNAFEINVPKEAVSIPAFFDGLLTNEITITPLKCGSFTFVIQIYPSIENINLPISPLSVVCEIKSEAIHIKRLLSSKNSSQINYNLFKECENFETFDVMLSNNYFSNEIPLKFSLSSSKCFMFEPLYRLPDSAIHSFRCPDAHSLLMVTKTQYEMRIPLKVHSFDGEENAVSTLTVAIDSANSHVIALYQLCATFWPKTELSEPSLQCSDISISLTSDEWKRIHFRNKSTKSAIHVKLDCLHNKSLIKSLVKFSSSEFIIPPKEKISIGLMIENKTLLKKSDEFHLLTKHDSGFAKSWTSLIPITIY